MHAQRPRRCPRGASWGCRVVSVKPGPPIMRTSGKPRRQGHQRGGQVEAPESSSRGEGPAGPGEHGVRRRRGQVRRACSLLPDGSRHRHPRLPHGRELPGCLLARSDPLPPVPGREQLATCERLHICVQLASSVMCTHALQADYEHRAGSDLQVAACAVMLHDVSLFLLPIRSLHDSSV